MLVAAVWRCYDCLMAQTEDFATCKRFLRISYRSWQIYGIVCAVFIVCASLLLLLLSAVSVIVALIASAAVSPVALLGQLAAIWFSR